MAHHTLIDTCVWIEMAGDPQAGEIASRLEGLIATTHFRLVVPDVVREEYARHKAGCSEKLAKRLSARVKETIQHVRDYADGEGKPALLAGLEAFSGRVADVSNAAARAADRIQALLDHPETRRLETTDEILRRAARRGYEKQAPFVGNQNSTADAIILESFLGFFARHEAGRCTFSFVTLDKSGFAAPKDRREPHPELGEPFADGRIKYSINLADEINRLIEVLPPAPRQEKKPLPEAVVRHVAEWQAHRYDPVVCPFCGKKALHDIGWRGFTWHKKCGNCDRFLDTGETMEGY